MGAFDYSDYRLWSKHEEWHNYDKESQNVRDFCQKVVPTTSKYGLVYNKKSKFWFMTLSRNLDNLTNDWHEKINDNGGEYQGEAFCGALLVYFALP